MYSITKIFEISYAHSLPNHQGKCQRQHGHNAIIEVTLASPNVEEMKYASDRGMVADFGDVKRICNEVILDKLDHRTLVKGTEWTYLAALEYLNGLEMTVANREHYLDEFVVLGFDTTAENLGRYVFSKLSEAFDKAFVSPLGVITITVAAVKWTETRDNVAGYIE